MDHKKIYDLSDVNCENYFKKQTQNFFKNVNFNHITYI